MLKSVSKWRGGKGAGRLLYNKVYGKRAGNARGTGFFCGNARFGEWTVLHLPKWTVLHYPSGQRSTIPSEQRSTIPTEQRSTYPSGRPITWEAVGLRVYIAVGLRLGKRVTCGLMDASPTG